MTRVITIALAAALTYASPPDEAPRLETWTGWFSDKNCARTPEAVEAVRPNGTECVKQCLLKGAKAVFISEEANAVFDVVGHRTVIDDVGYRVEVTAVVDFAAKSLSVRSVKRLSEVTEMCLLPKKRTGE